MSGTGGAGPDLLEGGGPDRPGRLEGRSTGLLPGPVQAFVRRHRRATTWLTAGVVVAAFLGLRWYGDRPPVAPAVLVAQDRSAESVPLWSADIEGRPGSPVTLSVSARLSTPDRHPGDPQVSAAGLAGPGVSAPGVFPHTAIGTRPQVFDLTGQVACDQVPIPLPRTAFLVQLLVRDGSRTGTATVPLQDSEDAVRQRVTYGCSTWLAARDLTVTAVSAQVDPDRPHVDLTMTVANRGARSGLVWIGDVSGTGVRMPALQRVVPAHRTVTLALPVDLDTCPSWNQLRLPETAADTPVPLLGGIGITEPLPADAVPLSQGPTGVPLTPAVAQQLQDALVQACGGVASPVLLTEKGTSRYDLKSRVLSTKVLVDLPPGVVGSVRFIAAAGQDTGMVPLFTASPWLVPDQSGQAGWPVRFSVPPDVACPGGGPYVALDVLLRVQTADGTTRVASFQLYAETLLPQRELDAACARGNG